MIGVYGKTTTNDVNELAIIYLEPNDCAKMLSARPETLFSEDESAGLPNRIELIFFYVLLGWLGYMTFLQPATIQILLAVPFFITVTSLICCIIWPCACCITVRDFLIDALGLRPWYNRTYAKKAKPTPEPSEDPENNKEEEESGSDESEISVANLTTVKMKK